MSPDLALFLESLPVNPYPFLTALKEAVGRGDSPAVIRRLAWMLVVAADDAFQVSRIMCPEVDREAFLKALDVGKGAGMQEVRDAVVRRSGVILGFVFGAGAKDMGELHRNMHYEHFGT